MTLHMQNPGVQAGASRDPIGIRPRNPLTAPGWRWQHIASRYRLPSSMAREVYWQCYGETRDD